MSTTSPHRKVVFSLSLSNEPHGCPTNHFVRVYYIHQTRSERGPPFFQSTAKTKLESAWSTHLRPGVSLYWLNHHPTMYLRGREASGGAIAFIYASINH